MFLLRDSRLEMSINKLLDQLATTTTDLICTWQINLESMPFVMFLESNLKHDWNLDCSTTREVNVLVLTSFELINKLQWSCLTDTMTCAKNIKSYYSKIYKITHKNRLISSPRGNTNATASNNKKYQRAKKRAII